MKPYQKLYFILTILSIAAYAWIGLNLFLPAFNRDTFTVCLFKNISSVPCPACGITRSVLLIVAGDMEGALLLNPLGGLAAIALVTLPVGIIIDVVTRKNTLASLFLWIQEKINTQRTIYIPLAALVLINWAWNILKGL